MSCVNEYENCGKTAVQLLKAHKTKIHKVGRQGKRRYKTLHILENYLNNGDKKSAQIIFMNTLNNRTSCRHLVEVFAPN